MNRVSVYDIGRAYVRAIMDGELVHDDDHEAAKMVVSTIQTITGHPAETVLEQFFCGIKHVLDELHNSNRIPIPSDKLPNDVAGMLSLLQTMHPQETPIGPGLCQPEQWVLLCLLDPEHRRTVPGYYHA